MERGGEKEEKGIREGEKVSREREEDNERERLWERFFRRKRGYGRERREKVGGRERDSER